MSCAHVRLWHKADMLNALTNVRNRTVTASKNKTRFVDGFSISEQESRSGLRDDYFFAHNVRDGTSSSSPGLPGCEVMSKLMFFS